MRIAARCQSAGQHRSIRGGPSDDNFNHKATYALDIGLLGKYITSCCQRAVTAHGCTNPSTTLRYFDKSRFSRVYNRIESIASLEEHVDLFDRALGESSDIEVLAYAPGLYR
jgi:hypothetical protein